MTPGYYFVHFANNPQWLIARVDALGEAWLPGSADPFDLTDFVFGPQIEMPVAASEAA